MEKTFYCNKEWLNEPESPSTGSVVCYHGIADFADGEGENLFIEIADCKSKVRLHKTHGSTRAQFIAKLERLQSALADFHDHLTSF